VKSGYSEVDVQMFWQQIGLCWCGVGYFLLLWVKCWLRSHMIKCGDFVMDRLSLRLIEFLT